jgi:curved DNA-binding protein CbpA
MTDHYQTLGVDRDADSATIKRAYRKRARETHPDHGGDTDEAANVNGAYMVLIDPDKRARYDRTGQDEAPRNELAMAMEAAGQFFDRAVVQAGDKYTVRSLIGDAQRAISDERAQGKQANKTLAQQVERTKKIIARLTHKAKGPNFLVDRLNETVRKQQHDIATNEDRLELLAKARELLDGYDFETDPLPTERPKTGSYDPYGDFKTVGWDIPDNPSYRSYRYEPERYRKD